MLHFIGRRGEVRKQCRLLSNIPGVATIQNKPSLCELRRKFIEISFISEPVVDPKIAAGENHQNSPSSIRQITLEPRIQHIQNL